MNKKKKSGTFTIDAESNEYIQKLVETDPLREPLLRRIISDLKLDAGSRGLDAGCGIGSQCLLLAEALGKNGHVTGMDINPDLLKFARQRVRSAGSADRIDFRKGDTHALPFSPASFDWLWSADCAGYREPDPIPLLHELTRAVKPGGRLFLLYYSSQMFLPGHPFLEARLNAILPRSTPFTPEMPPECHCFRTSGWLRSAGLTGIKAATYARTLLSPLDEDIRLGMKSLFDMLWEKAKMKLDSEDRSLYERLTNPDSADYILNIPDYYGFFTYTLFQAECPVSKD